MGNTGSLWGERSASRRESNRQQGGNRPNIPPILVTEASLLPAQESVFIPAGPVQTCRTGQANIALDELSPTDTQVHTEPPPLDLKETKQNPEVRNSFDVEDEGQFDLSSFGGSEGNTTPTASRQHFIQVMMNSSPQVRRSMVLQRSVHLSNRSDGDYISLVSSNPDEDRLLVTLDPLEHEWMMCASDGEWASLHRLLTKEPSFVLRKDFVTGFTCLHWAAKQGKPELITRIVNFAKQHNIPISVDVRSNIGYTPLHIAAMHSHIEVVKLLVGAYNADVQVRDYSGRKACQYLTDEVSVDIQDIIGAYEQTNLERKDSRTRGCRTFSKVLQSNMKPHRLLKSIYSDSVDGDTRTREKPLKRKSSLSRIKPRLLKLRFRASQIAHSTTFHDPEELEGSMDEI